VSAAASDDDDEFQFGEMIPFGDPSWYVTHSSSLCLDLCPVPMTMTTVT
jgi:hypothetical protein